jgi:hypothetical protein
MIMEIDPGASGQSQDFARFVELQQQHTETNNALEALEVKINKSAQDVAKTSAEAYVVLQEKLSNTDVELKALFDKHPEWRGDKKSVATPFGSVESRKATELEVPNPALTVALIKAKGAQEPQFKAADYLHVEEEPNLEALEAMTDDALALLGVNRKVSERVTVKPAKLNVAKAVKAAKAKQTAAN